MKRFRIVETYCQAPWSYKSSVNAENIYSGIGLVLDENEYKIIKEFDSFDEAMAELRKPEHAPSVTVYESNHVATVTERFIEAYDTDWYDEDGFCESPDFLEWETPWEFILGDEAGRFDFEIADK